jgi:hypothetical protein
MGPTVKVKVTIANYFLTHFAGFTVYLFLAEKHILSILVKSAALHIVLNILLCW